MQRASERRRPLWFALSLGASSALFCSLESENLPAVGRTQSAANYCSPSGGRVAFLATCEREKMAKIEQSVHFCTTCGAPTRLLFLPPRRALLLCCFSGGPFCLPLALWRPSTSADWRAASAGPRPSRTTSGQSSGWRMQRGLQEAKEEAQVFAFEEKIAA